MSRIYKRGKTWYVDCTYQGKRIRVAIGKTKEAAKLALKDMEVKIVKGEHLGIKKLRFNKFAKKYLTYSKASKAQSSYRRDTVSVYRHLIPYFKKKYLHEITTYDVEQYKTGRLNKAKPATVNRELSCLRHMLTQSIRWGYLKENPFLGVKFMKETPRTRYLTAEQLKKLLKECKGVIKTIVLTAINTGMRKGELVNLKWSDVDMANRQIRVVTHKTNTIRFIPINGPLYEALSFLPRYGEYVFSKKDGRPYGEFRMAYVKALKRAGLEGYTFHDLRHTFASHMVMMGVDIRTVQELLGHKDIRMTMRYAHLSKGKLSSAVKILGTHMAQKGVVEFWHSENRINREVKKQEKI